VQKEQNLLKQYHYRIGNQEFCVFDHPDMKLVRSKDYNYNFDKKTGSFQRWGATYEEDPQFSPIGPEIFDCECSTICNGIENKNGIKSPCAFCYKSNSPSGQNLSFEKFKKIFDKLPKSVGQIAFGSDAECISNPEIWEMMAYCRENGVIPNITVANINDETADKLAKYCGAVAVSRYDNKDVCYNSIKKLTDRGMPQINIHCMLSTNSYQTCIDTVNDMKEDSRLKNMNAVVFLGLKKRGRARKGFEIVLYEKFKELIEFCMKMNIRFGFDSCSSPRFTKIVKESNIDDEIKRQFLQVAEPCESGLFSMYTSTNGSFFPCSFCEGEGNWKDGLSVLECEDFYKDIWYHPRLVEWRNRLMTELDDNKSRKCLMFDEINL